MQLQFICVDCGHHWSLNVVDTPIIRIDIYDDLCPNCGCQNDPVDILELAEA